ncbi:MAG: SufD family Fe-S cluster assembly protein [Candidatus Marsarchaeota archaeon]|nr:SufD family Fe-S cluster assembly protein [Candidatus Marsarchaeota archaeon]MCL5111664.1 SufD family Fe-S cluster assembly protein [Candidatus Marsarchaeota archaeon]
MNPYGLFADDAIQRYRELPEEQNELYKKEFISLSPDHLLEIYQGKTAAPDTPAGLYAAAKSLFIKGEIRFDIIIGGSGHVINPGAKYVTVLPVSDIKIDALDAKLYRSSDDKLAALVHAFTNEFIFIDVPKGIKAKLNLLFLNITTPLATQVMINTGEGSELDILEWYASFSKTDSASCVMHEGKVGAYSNVVVDAVHNEDRNTVVVGLSKYNVGNNGDLKLNYFYNGGMSSKAKNKFCAVGHEGSIRVNELLFGSAKQRFDMTSNIENSAPSTTAELRSRAVLMDESRCIMKGFAKIPFGSKNARSFVHESGMLLDKTAYLNSMPAMSIDENEVKATHASATGPIDSDLIFYLMSKGLDEHVAKKLIVEGFFSSSIGSFKDINAKLAGASLVAEKMENGNFGGQLKLSTENIWVGRENEEGIFKGHYKYR